MPGKTVIVCSFDEPEDIMILGGIMLKAQEMFKPFPGVKLQMAISDVADQVLAIFAPLDEEKEETDGEDHPEAT